jgi:hypothetical protein
VCVELRGRVRCGAGVGRTTVYPIEFAVTAVQTDKHRYGDANHQYRDLQNQKRHRRWTNVYSGAGIVDELRQWPAKVPDSNGRVGPIVAKIGRPVPRD